MSVQPLTPDLAEELGLARSTQGVVVADLDPSGVAAESGLQEGDVIVKIDGRAVKDRRGDPISSGSAGRETVDAAGEPQGKQPSSRSRPSKIATGVPTNEARARALALFCTLRRSSFHSDRADRVHSDGAQRRKQRSRDRHDNGQQNGGGERERIGRRHAGEERLKRSAGGIRQRNARNEPRVVNAAARLRTMIRMSRRCAPSAMRTPISCVRCDTANDNSPWMPIAASR